MKLQSFPDDGNGCTRVLSVGGTVIGRAITRGFLDNGVIVVDVGQHPEPLAQTVAGCERGHAHITSVSNHE